MLQSGQRKCASGGAKTSSSWVLDGTQCYWAKFDTAGCNVWILTLSMLRPSSATTS
jgi:hypothetical protein